MGKANRRIYLVGSIVLTILIGITVLCIGIVLNQENSYAESETYKVSVNKISTVSVYVTGQDVEKNNIESNSKYDIYNVKKDATITLQAINESKIFTKWNIYETENSSQTVSLTDETQSKITLTVNKDLTVEVNRRDPVLSDYGSYMNNRFFISSATHLMYLQNIFDAGNNKTNINNDDVLKGYDYFFSDYSGYADIKDLIGISKATEIYNSNLFEKIQYGYFYVTTSFSLLDNNFKGIGTTTYPFQGKICGLNDTEIANIFITTSNEEETEDMYRGMFQVIGNDAMVRNLKIRTSIGISHNDNNTKNNNLYAGGLAGKIENALLVNLDVEANFSITTNSANINCGGLAGKMTGGIDSISNITCNGDNSVWILETNNGSINAGLVAGDASNVYIKELNANISNFAISADSTNNNTYDSNKNICLGNIFGYYDVTTDMIIENIYLIGEKRESIRSLISRGNAYLGGLIGYLNANKQITIGKVSINITDSKESIIDATSVDTSSQANLFVAGLIGYINGENCQTNDEFKEGIVSQTVDEKVIYRYNYIFNANLTISATQNGSADGSNYGKCIAAGMVAKGYIDIDGTDEKRTNLLICSPEYNLTINATQTSIAKHNNYSNGTSDKEHCIASLVFGLIKNGSFSKTLKNINVYSNNSSIVSTRELGSLGMGDVHTAGFIGVSTETNYKNISLLLNNCNMEADSLSYEVKCESADSNNTFIGGFIGEIVGKNSSNLAEMNNITLSGFDLDNPNNTEIGTTTKISSIQNTQPPGKDYVGENYCGGLVGRSYLAKLTNCKYIGSDSDEDYIQMLGHQSPDSAFVGGIIGFIKNNINSTIEVNDCLVLNANIYGSATNTNTSYGNPDIYVGGIIGACYHDYDSGILNLSNNRIYDSNIVAIGNERIEVYTAGILGVATWSGSTNINNCYVSNVEITSTVSATSNETIGNKGFTYAAGICANTTSCALKIEKCAVMGTTITTSSDYNVAISSGIQGHIYGINPEIKNCYSNVILNNVSKSKTSNEINKACYGIAEKGTISNCDYVLNSNVSGTGNQLNLSSKEVSTNTMIISSSNSKKYYIKTTDKFSFTIGNSTINATSLKSNVNEICEIWVNVDGYDEGNSLPYDYTSDLERSNAGWFKVGEIMLYSGTLTNKGTLENPSIAYVFGYQKEYSYNSENQVFKNIYYPYDEIEDVGYILNSSVNNQYDVKIYDGIPKFKLEFSINDTNVIYEPIFMDENNVIISSDNFTKSNYGVYNFSYKITDSNTTIYTFVFEPNLELLDDSMFKLQFKANNENYVSGEFILNLIANEYELVGFTYASYTLPLNYYLDNNNQLGTTKDNQYLLRTNSVTKIIPILTRENDPNKVKYISELNVDKVEYVLNGDGTMNSNGEFKTPNASDSEGTIEIRLKDDSSQTQTVYFKTVSVYSVSYSSVGSSLEGLTYATNMTEYVLKCNVLEHFGGIPSTLTIKIGNVTYSKEEIIKNNWIYSDENSNPIDNFTINQDYYEIRIPVGKIKGNIEISINFSIVYDIIFDLQIDTFNPSYVGDTKLEFMVFSGYSFNEFNSNNANLINETIENATLFGYVFTGFYLIDNGNSEIAYGSSYEEIVAAGLDIYTSYTFYARWSFLIELVEAPGTTIKSSFSDDFMVDYGKEMTEEELKQHNLSRAVTIPINANRGYVFTIVKDANFIGEADVKAYIIHDESRQLVDEIEIEKYHDNMYLYYIAPEKITGYLVIVTSVSNSSIIVGENTASVTDEIIPEDGVYTFKYIANHVKDQSYIYNSGNANAKSNLSLNRDLLIQFKEQSYDLNLKQTTIKDRYLDKDTVIEVYYNRYVNSMSDPIEVITGTYIVTDSQTSEIKLSDFYKWNLSSKAFSDITFNELLGDNETVSEVFYFVITPPNGANSYENNEIINNIIYVGYYDDSREDKFVTGIRNSNDFANLPIQDKLNEIAHYETAKQEKIYSETPSRITTLEKVENSDNEFIFTDITKYHLFGLNLINGNASNGKFILYDSGEYNTIIESDKITFGILQLKLRLGYGTGKVAVYGSVDGTEGSWELVDTIDVTNPNYQDYLVEFNSNSSYKYFKIDNISLTEIRLEKISITSINNAMVYEFNVSEAIITNDELNVKKYDFYKEVVGDTRHDGKRFVLAVQFKDTDNNIIEDIAENAIEIQINGKSYKPYLSEQKGKNVCYFDLTSIIESLNTDSFTLKILSNNNGYSWKTVQLLESVSIQKPAYSEVRVSIER